MRYKILGKSGLRVSELCLGTMTFGTEWGWGADHATSKALFDAFAEAGGNFIDTANRYTEGTSERWCGEFMAADRGRYVLATKYTLHERKGDPNGHGNHRKNLVQSVEASLRRLGTEYIDLLWVHAWDYSTPVAEVMRALDDLVRAGKVLHLGVSDTPAWIVAQANTMAELRGWTAFSALQVEYSLIQRTPERDLFPMATAFGMALTPWAPLAGGALTGKYLQGNDEPKRLAANSARLNDRNTAIAREVHRIAGQIGCTPAQVALAWIRQRHPSLIPIVGVRRLEQLQDNLGCLAVHLDAAHMQALTEISAIELGFPHDFLRSDAVGEILFGGTARDIDRQGWNFWHQ